MRATTDLGQSLTLDLRAVLPLEESSTRTRVVRFGAPGLAEMGHAAVGQSLTVDIPVGEARDLMSVPKDALMQSPGGWTVFVAQDNTAQPRQVSIGVPIGDRYEVTAGLSEGDLVVVRGNERLRPGQEITPQTVGN